MGTRSCLSNSSLLPQLFHSFLGENIHTDGGASYSNVYFFTPESSHRKLFNFAQPGCFFPWLFLPSRSVIRDKKNISREGSFRGRLFFLREGKFSVRNSPGNRVTLFDAVSITESCGKSSQGKNAGTRFSSPYQRIQFLPLLFSQICFTKMKKHDSFTPVQKPLIWVCAGISIVSSLRRHDTFPLSLPLAY